MSAKLLTPVTGDPRSAHQFDAFSSATLLSWLGRQAPAPKVYERQVSLAGQQPLWRQVEVEVCTATVAATMWWPWQAITTPPCLFEGC